MNPLFHPALALFAIAVITQRSTLTTKPIPVILWPYLLFALLRSLLLFIFGCFMWQVPYRYAAFQGGVAEDLLALLCALWCFLMMFFPVREDLDRIWHRQYIVFMSVILAAVLIYQTHGLNRPHWIELLCWGTTLFCAGVWWLLVAFGTWAGGFDQDAKQARWLAVGFLIIYSMDAVATGLQVWAPMLAAARWPLWMLMYSGTIAGQAIWAHHFKATVILKRY